MMEERSIDEALDEATEALIAVKDELMTLGEDALGSEIEKRFKRFTDIRARRDKLVEQWLQIRRDEGLKIDPATAEVFWTYGETADPYGTFESDPEWSFVGREYFARRPAERYLG
jgi:hypothetical protein